MIFALIILAALCMWIITQNKALRIINEKQRQTIAFYDRLTGWHGIHDGEQ
jgi:hypothetical protein